MGGCRSFPAERRPRASLPHRLPPCTSFRLLPPGPLRLQPWPADNRTKLFLHSQGLAPATPCFLNNHFRVKGELPESRLPLRLPWVVLYRIVPFPRPRASGRLATAAQAHKGRCQAERALPSGRGTRGAGLSAGTALGRVLFTGVKRPGFWELPSKKMMILSRKRFE